MSAVVADTNAALWFLFDPSRLSPAADAAITTASKSGQIFVSVITLVELVYLVPKPSFSYPNALNRLVPLIRNSSQPFEALPVTLDVADAIQRVPRDEIPDMPDRIIAATAVAARLPLVSSDSKIRGSATLAALVPVIW